MGRDLCLGFVVLFVKGRTDTFLRVKTEVLPLVQALCQDLETSVRACMCRHLDAISRTIGLEATKAVILPELVELSSDVECSVRLAALDTTARMMALLDDGERVHHYALRCTAAHLLFLLLCFSLPLFACCFVPLSTVLFLP